MHNEELTLDQQPQNTKVIFSTDARKRLYEGMSLSADVVGCTMGPKGKTVLIQKKNESPIVTKDGVTVSKSIKFKDNALKMGAELIKQAASQTNEVAGDGTTTATVLTHAMVHEGLKLLEAGYSSLHLTRGIELAISEVTNELVKSAKQLASSSEIAQIGTISANGDEKIGALIASAMEKVGRDGIITVEENKGMDTLLVLAEGMQFERGYVSPYFVTNNERMTAEYDDPYVMISDKKITSLREIIPILEKVVQTQRPLLIIAEDIEGDALQGLVLNKVKSNLPVVAVKAPGYGDHRKELLKDMCILSGAKLISDAEGLSFSGVKLEDLGRLKKVVSGAKSTTLVATGETKNAIDEHVATLKTQLQDVTLNQHELTKLRVRIAGLANGVAVIKVGGATELEMIERKYRIEDALNATKAAVEEGIVAGGGNALLNISRIVDKKFKESNLDRETLAGVSIVVNACQAPLKRIVSNAGCNAGVIIAKLEELKNTSLNIGYNAATEKYVDMFQEGIIDPVKVTRTALKNAASVAITFLNLDAIIVDEDHK